MSIIFAVHQSVFAALILVTISNGQLTLKNDLKAKFSMTPQSSLLSNSISDTTPCSCAVFMSGQFKKGSSDQPEGCPALIQETDIHFPCTATGNKMCVNKCLETIVKHLPNSPAIICGMVARDVHRERAYLWVQNCDKKNWTNSNLSAGRK